MFTRIEEFNEEGNKDLRLEELMKGYSLTLTQATLIEDVAVDALTKAIDIIDNQLSQLPLALQPYGLQHALSLGIYNMQVSWSMNERLLRSNCSCPKCTARRDALKDGGLGETRQ